MKHFRKAVRRDTDFLQRNKEDNQALSRWVDTQDPHGEIGIKPLRKALRRAGVTNFKYVNR